MKLKYFNHTHLHYLFLFVITQIGAAGCATEYYFRPLDGLEFTPRGILAATYRVPSPNGRGSIQIHALGLRKLKGKLSGKALVFKYILDNETHSSWKIDLVKQKLTFTDRSQNHLELISSSIDPLELIPPNQIRAFNLAFALPEKVRDESDFFHVTLNWEVTDSTAEKFTGSTRFELVTGESSQSPSIASSGKSKGRGSASPSSNSSKPSGDPVSVPDAHTGELLW